jgi:hypothetical protein
MGDKDIAAFIGRGALAGAVGYPWLLLYGALSYKFTLGYIPYSYIYIFYVPMYLMLGGIIGATIGGVIGICSIKSGRRLGTIVRALIGIGCVVGLSLVLQLLSDEDRSGVDRPSVRYRIVLYILTALLIGALPGIAARPSVKQTEAR